MSKPYKFFWTYEELGRLAGTTKNAVQQAVTRHEFDPDRLESVHIWLSRHGSVELRRKCFDYSIGHTKAGKEPSRRRRRPPDDGTGPQPEGDGGQKPRKPRKPRKKGKK